MARPNNAPMGAGFKKMNKDGLIRLLVDEMQENRKLQEENKKLKEDVDFYYKSAKQFREQVEKWEKDFVEGRIVEKD